MSGKSIVIFGATGAVGGALVDLLVTRPQAFAMPYPLRIVAAAPDAVAALSAKYPSAPSTGNGGGGGDKPPAEASLGGGAGGAAASPKPPASDVELVPIDVDANDPAAVRRALDAGQDRGHSLLAVAVCSAIGGYHLEPLSEMASGETVAQAVSREVLPAANVLKAAAHALAGGQHPDPPAAAGGHFFRASIVAISGAVVAHGMKHNEIFAARKGAVEAMYIAAAATLAQSRVKVNVVSPGLIRSPASAGVSMAEPAATKSAQLYPPHRLAEPEEVAAAVAVALSPALLPFTTGAVIPCDGGISRIQTYEAPTVHV